MKFELLSGAHSVGEANYHLQFTPAYRRDLFADESVRVLTRDYIVAAAARHSIVIAAIGFGPDHVHVFTERCKNLGCAQVARILKGFSSRMMQRHHAKLFANKLRSRFWSSGYFYRTVGMVNAETVRIYVSQSQEKHWPQPVRANPVQRNLFEFAG